MKLVPKKYRGNYEFDPALNFGFEELNIAGKFTFCISLVHREYVSQIQGEKIFLNLEEPNGFWCPSFRYPEGTFEKVFSICKYSTSFFDRLSRGRGEYVFFPVNMNFVPIKPGGDRPFDVVYSGHLGRNSIIKILQKLGDKGLRLCVISNSSHPLVTHRGVSHAEKMRLIASSKFSIVHNQLFVTRANVFALMKDFPNFREHGAFSHFKEYSFESDSNFELKVPPSLDLAARAVQGIERLTRLQKKNIGMMMKRLWLNKEVERAPQLKSRLFESSASGTIPIVIQDPWNLVDDWFESDEYIPSTEHDLAETILNSVGEYQNLTNLSQHLQDKTSREYSTKAFSEKYLLSY